MASPAAPSRLFRPLRTSSLAESEGVPRISPATTVLSSWRGKSKDGWARPEVETLYIAKGSPWENGYVESFTGRCRDELLNRELFLSLEDARWVLDQWQLDYNHRRPHSSLDHQTPAAYAASLPACVRATPSTPKGKLPYPRFSHYELGVSHRGTGIHQLVPSRRTALHDHPCVSGMEKRGSSRMLGSAFLVIY